MTPKEILKKFFGYDEFRPSQEEIILSILSGYNVLTVLPTGGGKSLCYQIPSLISERFSIVISPLIALMKDQVDAINKIEQVAAFINSSLDIRATDNILRNISGGSVKILYVSPEKISSIAFAEKLKELSPSYLFVDEAHCISEWGHNFRPSYRKLKEFADFIGIGKISAFTATATEEVRKDIIAQLGMADAKIFIRGFERENLHLNVIHTKNKKEKIAELLSGKNESSIIYSATRKSAEEVSEFLRSKKINSAFYHAGLTSDLRRMIQDDFASGRIRIISATNAFGMGIDKSDIRSIFHFNIPGSIENYYQEIGRAGRDGKEASIYLFYDEKDKFIQEYFIESSSPSVTQIEEVYRWICDYGKVALGNISEKDISLDNSFAAHLKSKNINQGILDASIKVLEESGLIRRRSDFDQKHYGKFLLDPKRLNNFAKSFTDAEMRDLILILARDYGSRIFKEKVLLNLAKISTILNAEQDMIQELFLSLGRSGVFLYESPSKFPAVRLITPRIESGGLKLDLERINFHAEKSREKLAEMVEYSFTEKCRFNFILNYFGQDAPDYKCGKCDICTGEIYSGRNTVEYLEEIILRTLHELKTPVKKKILFKIITGRADLPSLTKISTFNSCVHFNQEELENTVNSLTRKNLLLLSQDTLSLSDGGRNFFAEPEETISQSSYEEELELFNRLRQVRKEIAEKFVQNQQLICSDETLREIARREPLNEAELLSIPGFTQRMFNKIGEEFISITAEFAGRKYISEKIKQQKIPDNILRIHEMVSKRYSLEDISSMLKIPESVVAAQIEVLIEMEPELEVEFLFNKKELKSIYRKIDEGITDLKLLRESLNEKIGYSKLRIAVAKKRVS